MPVGTATWSRSGTDGHRRVPRQSKRPDAARGRSWYSTSARKLQSSNDTYTRSGCRSEEQLQQGANMQHWLYLVPTIGSRKFMHFFTDFSRFDLVRFICILSGLANTFCRITEGRLEGMIRKLENKRRAKNTKKRREGIGVWFGLAWSTLRTGKKNIKKREEGYESKRIPNYMYLFGGIHVPYLASLLLAYSFCFLLLFHLSCLGYYSTGLDIHDIVGRTMDHVC